MFLRFVTVLSLRCLSRVLYLIKASYFSAWLHKILSHNSLSSYAVSYKKMPLLTDNYKHVCLARLYKYQETATAGVPLFHSDWEINSNSCIRFFWALVGYNCPSPFTQDPLDWFFVYLPSPKAQGEMMHVTGNAPDGVLKLRIVEMEQQIPP